MVSKINLALKKDFSVCGWWSHTHIQTHNMDTPNKNICPHTDIHLLVLLKMLLTAVVQRH